MLGMAGQASMNTGSTMLRDDILACFNNMYMLCELNRVVLRAFAIFAPCDSMLMRTITCANDITCNVGVRGGEGPRFLHQLAVLVC